MPSADAFAAEISAVTEISALSLAGNAEFLHACLQRGALDAEPRCRAVGAADHPAGFFQDAQYVFAFVVCQRRACIS